MPIASLKWRNWLAKNNMSIRSITELKNVKNKRVLVRLDLNVPVKKGKVLDTARLKAVIPTLQWLRKKGARIIIVTHLGRPAGTVVPELKVAPVAKALAALLKMPIPVVEMKKASGKESIVMLENIRFNPGEEKNDPALAKQLADLADVFVFDGFAVAHRAAASVVGVAKYLPAYAGLLVAKEVAALGTVLEKPKHPFVAIIGGAKIETRLPVLQKIGQHADAVIVGGGILNTVLASLSYKVGESLVDRAFLKQAKALTKKMHLLLPIDVVVGTRDGQNWRVVELAAKPHQVCEPGEAIFDLGPATIGWLQEILLAPKTILWSGAVGLFEQAPYNEATFAIARVLAQATKRGAFTVAGGGETLLALDALSLTKKLSFVSTAGGAMLEYLAGRSLPGVKILQTK